MRSLVEPVERGGRYVFQWASTLFEVDPTLAGRVTRLEFEGDAILTGAEINQDNWGSTYWTSPQADWGWPPPAGIDTDPYAVQVVESTLKLKSAVTNVGSTDVTVEKHFGIDPAADAIDIRYVVNNVGTRAARLASWEITRVFPKGLTFYPTGATTSVVQGDFPYSEQGGVTWFDEASASYNDHIKLVGDGHDGWLAHVTAGRVLLLKRFDDVPATEQAAGEGEIEIYANPERTYVEVENQGRYVDVPAGGSLDYALRWYLRRVPDGIDVAVGNPELVAHVVNLGCATER